MKRFEQIINSYLVEQEDQQPEINIEDLFAQVSQAINTSSNIGPGEKQRYITEIERLAQDVHQSLESGKSTETPSNNPVQVSQGAPQGLKSAGAGNMAFA